MVSGGIWLVPRTQNLEIDRQSLHQLLCFGNQATNIDQDLTAINEEYGKGSYRAAFYSLTENYLN